MLSSKVYVYTSYVFILDHITTSSTTTGPHTIPTTPNPDGSPTSNTVTYTQSSKIITTSSAIPIITVTRSGTSTFTVVSTSYSMYTTSVPTNISDIVKPSSVNSSAIAGGVVGGVAFIVLIGKYKQRKKLHKYIGNA